MLIDMGERKVTLETAIRAARYAEKLAMAHRRNPAAAMAPGETAIRAVLANDPAIMAWIEGAVTAMDREHETMRGETRRSSRDAQRADSGELSHWKAALTVTQRAARGGVSAHDLRAFTFILGAAAIEAGLSPRPYLE